MDLVTRLLLNTSQFDNNIRSSTQQIQGFQSVGKSITSTIGKFAGVIGLSMGAMEAFNKTMNATQGTADVYEKIMTQATTATDYFFSSLSQADFSNFITGINNAIKKAGEYAEAMDLLASKTLFNDLEINNLETKRQVALNKAKDKTLSDVERNKANKEAEKYQKRIITRKEDLNQTNLEAGYAGVRKVLAKNGYQGTITNAQISKMMQESDRANRDKEVEKYNRNMDDYNRRMNQHHNGNYQSGYTYDKKYWEIKAQRDAYNSKSYGKLNQVINNTQEDELKPYFELFKTANSQLIDISNSTLEMHNTAAKINGSWKKLHKQNDPDAPTITIYNGDGSTSTVKKTKGINNIANQGSIDEVNQQLAEARKKYDAAATDELRAELFGVIKELEDRKIQLNFVAQYGDMKDVKPKMAALGDAAKDTDISKFNKLPTNFSNSITKKDIALNNDYADSLNAISNTLGAITNMTNEGASAWLSWGATLLSSIASAIPAISALTVAKTAEANANSAAAVTGGVSSAAQTPLIGWLLAGAAAASVIAALSNVPKFANGGLVYGNSIVNVGEYAGASSNPEVIAPLNKLKKLIKPEDGNAFAGNVTFEIEGRKLVGVLSNYNKQQNRIK